MRLLATGFTTAETTLAGITSGSAHQYGAGRNFVVRKVIVMSGGSSVAANSSGLANVVFGMSSDAPESTLTFPTPRSGDASSATAAAAEQWEVEGLAIRCGWFEARTNEANNGGVSVFILGD